MEILEKYNFVLPFSTIATYMLYEDELVIFCCQDTVIVKLLFFSVIAYRSHDDFHHPDLWLENKTKYPRTSDGKYPYPALEVVDSDWLNSFPGCQTRFGGKLARHYRFASYNNVVDILTTQEFSDSVAGLDDLEAHTVKFKNELLNGCVKDLQ